MRQQNTCEVAHGNGKGSDGSGIFGGLVASNSILVLLDLKIMYIFTLEQNKFSIIPLAPKVLSLPAQIGSAHVEHFLGVLASEGFHIRMSKAEK